MNVMYLYDYLGGADITIQTEFGFQYIKNFMGYSTVFLLSDEEIKDLSWTSFVAGCSQLPELVRYLKERRLYINEPVLSDAEV